MKDELDAYEKPSLFWFCLKRVGSCGPGVCVCGGGHIGGSVGLRAGVVGGLGLDGHGRADPRPHDLLPAGYTEVLQHHEKS